MKLRAFSYVLYHNVTTLHQKNVLHSIDKALDTKNSWMKSLKPRHKTYPGLEQSFLRLVLLPGTDESSNLDLCNGTFFFNVLTS